MNPPNTLVILGSARGDSNTLAAVRRLCPYPDYELADLRDYRINPYDYAQAGNQTDDFPRLVEKLRAADVIVFATPVYWYSMSGSMKVFFDRMTDLTGHYKAVGRSLKGKKTRLIVSGGAPELPPGFELPFKDTSEYFDMEFLGTLYQQGR